MGRQRWLVAAAATVLGLGVGAPAVSAETGSDPRGPARVEVLETYGAGRVLDAVSGTPIRNAVVRYVPQGLSLVEGVDRTDADGRFLVTGLEHEEYAIRVNAARYVGGYLGCSFLLYPTFEQACTHAPGDLAGDILMVRR